MKTRRLRRAAVALGLAVLSMSPVAVPSASAAPGRAAEPDLPYFDDITGSSISVDGTYLPVVGHFTDLLLDDIIWYARGTAVDNRWTPCPGCETGRFTKAKLVPQVNGQYQPIVGDFAGDKLDDIYWLAFDGADYLWTNNGSGGFTSRRLDAPAGYRDPLVITDSEFGSGKDDLLWRHVPEHGPVVGALWVFPDNGSGAARTRWRPQVPQGEPTVGDFDGNGTADVLWYVANNGCSYDCRPPSAFPDVLWRRSASEAPAFAASTRNVKGSYFPVAGRLSGADDETRSDILWIGGSYGYRGSYQPGPDSLWEGRANGGFTSSTPVIPFASRGTVLERDGADHVLLFDGTTASIWFDTTSGPVLREAGGTFAYGTEDLVGRFTTADRDDVFTYRSGTAKEHLYHPIS